MGPWKFRYGPGNPQSDLARRTRPRSLPPARGGPRQRMDLPLDAIPPKGPPEAGRRRCPRGTVPPPRTGHPKPDQDVDHGPNRGGTLRCDGPLDRCPESGTRSSATLDWAAAMALWSWPKGGGATTWNLAGHDGVDVQWRRPHSTWYGQFRVNPRRVAGPMSALDLQTPRRQFMAGHVRHGERWTVWTEWAPTLIHVWRPRPEPA